jgi:hypothetical protein
MWYDVATWTSEIAARVRRIADVEYRLSHSAHSTGAEYAVSHSRAGAGRLPPELADRVAEEEQFDELRKRLERHPCSH